MSDEDKDALQLWIGALMTVLGCLLVAGLLHG